MFAEAERLESMQADANILVIGIISHKKGAVSKHDTSIRDQNRVIALKKESKSVFTIARAVFLVLFMALTVSARAPSHHCSCCC